LNTRLDELATAYVQIVAATAGMTIAVSRRDYGVDGTLKSIVQIPGGRYAESGFPVDFQLKGTTTVQPRGDHVGYSLKSRNYDLIVMRPPVAAPYYLFLVCFPRSADEWVEEDVQKLILNASAYWWSDSGPATDNASSVRIQIPKRNRLTSESIGNMLRAYESRLRP
jgi:hypothetical protein